MGDQERCALFEARLRVGLAGGIEKRQAGALQADPRQVCQARVGDVEGEQGRRQRLDGVPERTGELHPAGRAAAGKQQHLSCDRLRDRLAALLSKEDCNLKQGRFSREFFD